MGGNAFESTKMIEKSQVLDLVDDFKEVYKLYLEDFIDLTNLVPVGSYAYKPYRDMLGDIDLIGEIKFKSFKNVTHTLGIEISDKGFDNIPITVPLQIYPKAIDLAKNALKMNGIEFRDFSANGFLSFLFRGYQIDLNFVDNLEWSKFAFGHSHKYESAYKYAYRNEILYVLAGFDSTCFPVNFGSDKLNYTRHFYNLHNGYEEGVSSSVKTSFFPKKSSDGIWIKTNDPKEFLDRLFTIELDPDTISFEILVAAIKGGKLRINADPDLVFAKVIQGLNKKKLPIPVELK